MTGRTEAGLPSSSAQGVLDMIQVRRLGVVVAGLALVALITCTQVRGGPDKEALQKPRASDRDPDGGKAGGLDDDLAATKFAEQKVVVYQTRDKDVKFGWQLKPALKEAADARPRDILVLVDTSASQHRGPLQVARKLAEAVIKDMGDDDRLALWTVNVEPKPLTEGFEQKDKFESALKTLTDE